METESSAAKQKSPENTTQQAKKSVGRSTRNNRPENIPPEQEKLPQLSTAKQDVASVSEKIRQSRHGQPKKNLGTLESSKSEEASQADRQVVRADHLAELGADQKGKTLRTRQRAGIIFAYKLLHLYNSSLSYT